MTAILRKLAWGLALTFGLLQAPGAQVTEAQSTAQGSGMTREEAVQSAIVNAAGQAFGIDIQASTHVQSMAAEASQGGNHQDVFLSSINKVVQQQVRTPGNNPILGYTVDDATQTGEMAWEATVTLRYAQFQRMGADSERRSIVVATTAKRYRDLVTSTVGESVVASRRFDVLNRQHANLFDDEKDFILGGDAGSAEVARLSQATGADYLLIAELQGLSVRNNQRETIRMTGEVLVRSTASGTLKLQIVEFASRKVKWSATQKFGATYEGASSVGEATLARLIAGAADKLIDQMVAAIYPIRVVKVMGGTAIINRGEGSINLGDTYAVFLMGDELVDPQSGESLGAMEVEVGIGQITDVKPKFSFLKMATGTLDAQGDYLLRKTSKKPPAATPPRSAARPAAKPAAPKPAAPSRKDVFLN